MVGMKIAIAGGGTGFKNAIETGCEVWTIQSVFKKLGKADKVFRFHQHELSMPTIEGVEIMGFNNLPVARLIESFGPYFHSSISWLFGYAVIIGCKHIELHGVDMLTESEYGGQRDSLFRMIGISQTIGVNVIIPEWSGVYIRPKLYEYKEL